MIRESRKKDCEEIAVEIMIDENTDDCVCKRNVDNPLAFKKMLALAVATSIDALAVGVTFAFLKVDIASAASTIGIVTFALSMIGVKIGHVFGTIYKSKAELIGGLILILMGTKILFEHLGMINF